MLLRAVLACRLPLIGCSEMRREEAPSMSGPFYDAGSESSREFNAST
jgi:hypothetical protein